MYSPEELIIDEEGSALDIFEERCIYFIKNGEVSLQLYQKKEEFRGNPITVPFAVLEVLIKLIYINRYHNHQKKNATFGEIGFFSDLNRCCSVKATEFTNIVFLSRKNLFKSLWHMNVF